MNRKIAILIVIILGVLFTWVFPLFRLVPLDQVAEAKTTAEFDSASFAKEFWNKQLIPNIEQATDAMELMAAIKNDKEIARKTFGKSVGIGRVYFYFLRGEGMIVGVEKRGVAISCTAPVVEADLVLKTGLLFGNTIRDATGQLLAGDFANSQDFNAVSKELNRVVENQVLPALKTQAKVGKKIRFVGCAEVRTSSNNILPLTVIPLQVEFPE